MSPPADPQADAPDDPDEGSRDDPETTTSSERTREIIHDLAVGLNKLGKRLSELRDDAAKQAEEAAHRAKDTAQRARESPTSRRAEEMARTSAERAAETARQAAERARHAADTARDRSREAVIAADEAFGKARAIALGFVSKAEGATGHTTERVQEMANELQERARKTTEAGRDFYKEHREEILALLITAAKVAAVIGIRRIAAGREEEETEAEAADREKKTKRRTGDPARRLIDSVTVLSAVVTQLGRLLAKQPSSLPMLREMYARGEPSEQAIVGMLLGPALSSNPDHAVDVVHEFLEGATSEGAADTIARRTLAPLLTEHPELVDKVTPWVKAAAPFVRRAALLALGRFVADRKSRLGDVVAAAVVVLEDHDEEVRRALSRLLQRAASVDPDATAAAIAAHLDAEEPEARARAKEVVDRLPEDLRDRIDAARTDHEPQEP